MSSTADTTAGTTAATHDEFLSQDEVDALLRGVTGEPEQEVETNKQDIGGVRSYNLATQERIVRGRMPTLEIINERFARQFRLALFNFMRRAAEITVSPIKVMKYSEFLRNLHVPTNLNLVHIKPLRGTALFVFDPDIIFIIVDTLFGGDGRYHVRVEGREFTQTEQRIIRRMVDLVFECYKSSWGSIYPIELEYVRAEMHTQFANITTPNEVIVNTAINIDFGATQGNLHLCIPYSMIEPIREILTSINQGEGVEADKRWIGLMAQEVQGAEVELVAPLANARITIEQLLQIKAGDVIPINMYEEITATVDGVPVMECSYGISNRQYSLRVNRLLDHTQNEFKEHDDEHR
jgi:flagellar motor switch protein FliM